MTTSQWKVGSTQATIAGVGSRGRQGYSFSIQNSRGAPLLTIMYESREEAEEAEAAVRKAISTAIEITPQRQ